MFNKLFFVSIKCSNVLHLIIRMLVFNAISIMCKMLQISFRPTVFSLISNLRVKRTVMVAVHCETEEGGRGFHQRLSFYPETTIRDADDAGLASYFVVEEKTALLARY